MLEIKNLTKYYKDVKGVEDLSLNIDKGEIFGFIGPNGAGKSTTIKCVMNLINKTSGDIYINKKLNDKDNISLKKIIGYLPDEVHLYDDLTVTQMFEYSNSFYKKHYSKRIEYLVEKLDIDVTKKIEELSLGNLKKVGIVLAMMHEPKLLILDEATSGLDPLMKEIFYELLLEEKKKGTTIFFSSHNLSEIKKICDRVGIIKDGHLVTVDTIEELSTNHLEIITIVSKDISKIKKELNQELISEDKNKIKFIHKDDINNLINLLSKYNIEKILIEDPEVEDIFMHYYRR
ncbi:MAG: ABC transporter ATP-binding protein [Bacilli bacterium]|nr:ABC transporter ATP-binding protein [Bacilli bacterium]MDD4282348.1 ABC transporter ATP-binding protein [Bacilli bacterium]MDD4718463.1 ABC transporter ATP-binding protein [Bacilli bacterium]